MIVIFLSACFANREKINKPRGEELYRLNINIEASTWGAVSVEPQKSRYIHGEEVTLNVKPLSGYRFKSWNGTDSKYVLNNKILI